MVILPKHSRDARDELGLSQTVVAKAIQLNRNYLSGWENGTKVLHDEILVRLYEFYESKGYVFPDMEGMSLDEVLAAPVAPVTPVAPVAPVGRVIPDGFYIVDGYLIPEGISPGTVENILEEVAFNTDMIDFFLSDEKRVEPIFKKGGWFEEDSSDETPVENQKSKSLGFIKLMARNHFLLMKLRGERYEAYITTGRSADYDQHFKGFDKTNAGVVSVMLDDGYEARGKAA